MTAPQLVYCVEDVFSRCLTDYEVYNFRISAYQRGYKWEHEVDKLLYDLNEAYASDNRGEYYLQYITVKKQLDPESNTPFLDVIDGQQRLTTLSLFFAVLGQRVPDKFKFAERRLEYAVRENFLLEFVYAGMVKKLLQPVDDEKNAWKEFICEHSDYDCQDVWYLFRAARTINTFLHRAEALGLSVADFGTYAAERVMLIVNLVEGPTSSEKVFRNLNSSKVPLTETELLKGLLLTKVAREPRSVHSLPSPREVVEIRTTMGRHWDEMSHWLNRPEVAAFFKPVGLTAPFGESLFPILRLVAQHTGYTDVNRAANEPRFPVFEHLQKNIRKGQVTATNYFNRLRLVFDLLRNWYEQTETYNLLGFVLFSKQVPEREKSSLLGMLTNEEWLKENQKQGLGINAYLNQRIGELGFLNINPTALRYGADDSAIHDLLLLVNVFPLRPAQHPVIRFDFASFGNGAWSLEHINPQNPDLNSLLRLSLLDRLRVVEIVEPVHQKSLQKLLKQKQSLSDIQWEELATHFRPESMQLHGVGNMVLLERKHNSTLRNAWFDEKRRRIVNLVSTGGFVPSHTFNVFSRLLLHTSSGSVTLWAKADVQAHATYISNEWERLVRNFKPVSV